MKQSFAIGRAAVAASAGVGVGAAYLAPLWVAPSPREIALAVMLGLCAFAGAQSWRGSGRASWMLGVPAFVAALLTALSVPLANADYPDLRITATGQKNRQSAASEVYVQILSEPVPGRGRFEGDNWEQRGDVFVSYAHQPAVLHYRGAWSSGAALRLVRHPNSGIAEIAIGPQTQRVDLFGPTETHVDVPLPEPAISWKSHLRRAAIAAGLGMLFAALMISLARVAPAWGGVLVLALLAGSGTLWGLKDRSYVGAMEAIAFGMGSAPARIEMDAGHGFTPALVIPVQGGTAVTTEFAQSDAASWRLGIEGGELRALRDLAAQPPHESASALDHGCSVQTEGQCVYEAQAADPLQLQLWLQAGSARHALALPEPTAHGQRLFVLVERRPGTIAVSASRAHLRLSPWEQFSRWIRALRIIGQDARPADKLVWLQSDRAYQRAESTGAGGAFHAPTLFRADTGNFVGMKLFAALISASVVLLLAAISKIARALAESYRAGHRLQVAGTLLGCVGWLSLGLMVGWPGIIGWDGFSPYIQSQTGSVTLWYGIGYPMLVGGFLLLGSGALVTLWSTLATAVLLLGTAALLLRQSSRTASWLAPVLLCIALPCTVVVVGMLTHLRDAMNGLLLAMFAFCCLYVSLRWRQWHPSQRRVTWVGLLIAGAVLALLRVDNLPTLLLLAAGLIFTTMRFSVRGVGLLGLAAAFWIGVGPIAERIAVPDRNAAAQEKRLYASTALINPLTGMLVHGRGRIPDALRADIHAALDRVMDVEVAMQRWSPTHIIYWHDTMGQRATPNIATIAQLRAVYLRALAADPVLFMRLRMATFGAMLGSAWIMPEIEGQPKGLEKPSFHDHLLSTLPYWHGLSELFGYAPVAHPHAEQTRALIAWHEKLATTAPQLLVCMLIALCIRRSPMASTVAIGELVRAGVFLLLAPASVFLYLYDMHLLGLLLPMMAVTEACERAGRHAKESAT